MNNKFKNDFNKILMASAGINDANLQKELRVLLSDSDSKEKILTKIVKDLERGGEGQTMDAHYVAGIVMYERDSLKLSSMIGQHSNMLKDMVERFLSPSIARSLGEGIAHCVQIHKDIEKNKSNDNDLTLKV